MALVKKKIMKEVLVYFTCVVEMGQRRRWVVLFVDYLYWFLPVILVLTQKPLCTCAEVVLVRGASESTGKAEIAQGNLCENLVLLGSLRDVSRVLQNYVSMFKFLGGNVIQPLMGQVWSLLVRRCLKVFKL